MRTDLNMRKGKMVAQGAHAAISCFLIYGNETTEPNLEKWTSQGMRKICVRCDSEQQLLDIANRAVAAGLIVNVITDRGDTEFHSVPTKTCLAIGPNEEVEIDKITGDLKLL